jgi:SAM-dependent methyltransferase
VLDVGCSSGLFSLGLAAAGYRVSGVDSNIAADVQGFYPEKPLSIAERLKADLPHADVTFIQGDVADVLATETACYDVCLLLSVVHQWFAGYALTGVGVKPLDRIEDTLRALVSHVTRVIYYEGPEDDAAAAAMHLRLPAWFIETGLLQAATPIAVSAAANGSLRTLYRMEVPASDRQYL